VTDYLLIQALNGLVIGITYAVIAAGLTVIFSILKIVNFAHGEVYMMGGYFAYFAIALAGIRRCPRCWWRWRCPSSCRSWWSARC
jgi:branched-subunit amino acid ABC-type transport system permease component